MERYHAPKGLLSRRDDAIRVLRCLIHAPDLQHLYERLGKDPSANQIRKTSSSSPTQSVFSSALSRFGSKPASKPSRSTSLANDLTAPRFNLPRLSKPRRVSNGIIHVHNSVITSIPNDLPQTVLPSESEQRSRKSSLKGDAEIPSLADMMKADIKDVRKFSAGNSKPSTEGDKFTSTQQPELRRCSTDLADKRLSAATTINSPELESLYAFHKKGRRRSPHLHEIVSKHAAQKLGTEVQVASAMLPTQTQAQPLIPGSDLPAPLHKLHLERMASMSNHMEHAMKRDRRAGADQKPQRLSLEIPGVNGERRKSIEKVHVSENSHYNSIEANLVRIGWQTMLETNLCLWDLPLSSESHHDIIQSIAMCHRELLQSRPAALSCLMKATNLGALGLQITPCPFKRLF